MNLPNTKLRWLLSLTIFGAETLLLELRAQAAADTAYYALTSSGRRDTMSIRVSDGDLPVLIFQVNKYVVSDERRLADIARLADSLWLEQRLDRVWIAGSASPEGSVAWNRKLGEYRANVLADYLRSHTLLPHDRMQVDNLGEDWVTLEAMLRSRLASADTPQAQRDAYERVLRIIAEEPDWARRKSAVKALDGGATWSHLLRDLFPPLRNARLALICYEGTFTPVGVGSSLAAPIASGLSEASVADCVLPPLPRYEGYATEQAKRRSRYIAVGTNLLFCAALVANAEAEVEFCPRWTIDLPVCFSPYDITETWRIRLLSAQPEVRRWTSEAGRGHYVGLHATVAGFNVALNTPGRYQDPDRAAWGFGLGYGYAFDLGRRRRWNLTLSAGLGFVNYHYREFVNHRNGELSRTGRGIYWGPTRLGATVAYVIR